jgi:hypothetical protein
VRSEERSNFLASSPSSSTRLIERSAVGAVNNVCTLWRSITRQKLDASGVPTGLPSYISVVQPISKGPYTE